jgi:hypothetical protein
VSFVSICTLEGEVAFCLLTRFFSRKTVRTIAHEVSNNTLCILQHQDKLGSLAKLAKSPDISDVDLRHFAEHPEMIKRFQSLTEKITAQEFKDLEGIIAEIPIDQISRLMENRTKLNTLAFLQESAAESHSKIIEALQEIGIYNVVENIFDNRSQGASIKPPESRSEPFIDPENAAAIGKAGEKFIYQLLIEEFGRERVEWLNENGESGEAYDFKIAGIKGKETLYVDAKATSTHEPDSDRYAFYVGSSEWRFSAISNYYYLARVFDVWGNPTVRYLKFVRSLDT